MPAILAGTYTIREALQLTYEYARNRFEYMKRDVLKRVTIQQVKQYDRDRHNAPSIMYLVTTYSYPQYPPYNKNMKKGVTKQRKYRHQYSVVFQFGEDGLALDTTKWKSRVGSQGKWNSHPPQSVVKTIYKENSRWSPEMKKQHRATAPYLDAGDWNSRVKGLNGDFVFRLAYAYNKWGHLYGRQIGAYDVPAKITNELNVLFLTKHQLNVIVLLMNRGLLK